VDKGQDGDGRDSTTLPAWEGDATLASSHEIVVDTRLRKSSQRVALDAAHATVSRSSDPLTCLCAVEYCVLRPGGQFAIRCNDEGSQDCAPKPGSRYFLGGAGAKRSDGDGERGSSTQHAGAVWRAVSTVRAQCILKAVLEAVIALLLKGYRQTRVVLQSTGKQVALLASSLVDGSDPKRPYGGGLG
jgi:hypothetical protein